MPPCPDAGHLAAYIDGRLDAPDRAVVEAHLVQCEDCRTVLADTIHLQHEYPADDLPASRFGRRPLAVGGALLVAAAALILMVVQAPRDPYAAELRDLVAAVGTSRPIEPRLTGGFAYGPRTVTRGTASSLSPELRIAAARVQERAGGSATADSLHADAVASILLSDAARAAERLERATALGSATAPLLSDLAAAYLVRAEATGQASDATLALAAADRALALDPDLPEALFNRALAMEAAGDDAAARQAWRDYLRRDPGSEWAVEARERLGRLDVERPRRP
jgi:anti-sigma factor RsiW